MSGWRPSLLWGMVCAAMLVVASVQGQECAYLYGIHDHDPSPQEWLNHVAAGGARSWITATVAIGHNPNDYGGANFTTFSNQGHAVICRLNNGYGEDGTIPTTDQYANFAQRCANFVNATTGCDMFIIGNETNLANEWPKVNGWRSYISPQSYASCFRLCYNAIKSVKPNAKVLCQALAPFAGPYGAGSDHDGNPLGWTTYMNQMLTAIGASGGIDGIAVHINSRGYTYADVHSTAQVNGQYWSFYVYKDWVNLGTPASMRTLPYYATECNGIYYWKGGHPECSSCSNASCCYQADWIEWIYQEINSWNQAHAATGEGIYRCVNMYRWCSWCDGWNIDGSPQKGQILTDLDQAVTQQYTWPGSGGGGSQCWGLGPGNPSGSNLSLTAAYYIESGRNNTSQYGKYALDGLTTTKWCCNRTQSGGTSTLAVDLGATCTVTGYIVRHAQTGGESASMNTEFFRVESSTSMFGPWNTEWDVNNSCQDPYNRFIYSTPKSLRYIRLVVTDAGVDDWVRLPEFEIYGTAGARDTITVYACDYQGGVNAASGTDYYDTTSGNSGGQYRSHNVDIETCTDGRYNVGWIAAGEWLNFPIQGQGSGTYTLYVRYATPNSSRTCSFKLNGAALTGTLALNNTGGWQSWQTLNAGNVELGTGFKTIQVYCNSDSFNIQRFWLQPAGAGGMVDEVPTGDNLSLTASQVAVDSQYGPDWGGNKAIDGVLDSSSKWASADAAPPHWLKLDLGAEKTVNGFIVKHEGATGSPSYWNTEQFRIQSGTSYDGPWTDETVVDNSAQANITNRKYVTPKSLRYVRLYITDPGPDNIARIPEFEVRGQGGGGKTTVAEDFNSMPSWSSSWDASWGSAASWAVETPGQSGTALRASRSSQGSSTKVKVYSITPNSSYTLSIYIRCPSYSGSYWAECAYRLGSYTAQNFDESSSSWTMIKKFSNDGTNGNGDTFVQYTTTFNSGSNTQISVGYKLGSSGGGGPTVRWDTLRIQ